MRTKALKFILLIGIGFIGINSGACKSRRKSDKVGASEKSNLEDVFIQSNSNLVKLETGYVIEGQLKNKPKNLIMLTEMQNQQLVFVDSVRTDESGNFKIKGDLKHPLLCQLQWGPEASVVVVLKNKAKLKLEIDPANPNAYKVSGDEIAPTLAIKELIDLNIVYQNQFTNLENSARLIDQQAPDAQMQVIALQNKYYALIAQRNTDIRNKAMSAENSLVPYFVVAMQMLNETDLELIKRAKEVTEAFAPSSSYTSYLVSLYESERQLGIGAEAPLFTMNQVDGKPLKLSDLRGKVVLLDFWASWCGPCRRENPNVVRMYEKFKDQGFEILGISLDDNKDRWVGAIATDKLTWRHVSELKGWGGTVNRMYQVS
jgi:thiol-disulfide isomerase/thioredoxin